MSEEGIDKPTDSARHGAAGGGQVNPWRASRRWGALAAAVLALTGAALWAADAQLRRGELERRLLAVVPDAAAADPALAGFAVAQARPLYLRHCASCHGADLHGNTALGAPNLADGVWLYGSGSVYDIERTLLYGIRSGHGKARNVTDMPAFGQRGMLTAAQLRDLVQYLLKLDHRPYEAQAAQEGRALYFGQGDCGDCHGGDARGDSDYGAPDLTADVWNSGGDAQSLYRSLYFGRHRIMPAWLGPLNLEQIRALAVYVYLSSHPPAAAHAGGRAG
ncbi:MAG TPA: c-type cytochrome [Steroidobacteraceae bacterium]|nr:c-type cytochrome [Steroidobacteraceae bacterium]